MRYYYYSCNGRESSLDNCSSYSLSHYNCRSYDAAGVHCIDLPSNSKYIHYICLHHQILQLYEVTGYVLFVSKG